MLRSIVLSAFIIALTTVPALAADLPVHSRLGAVFAEPVTPPRYEEPRTDGPIWTYAPEVGADPLVGGYYGKPNSYYYRSYYGTDWGWRLPYVCGLYGYC